MSCVLDGLLECRRSTLTSESRILGRRRRVVAASVEAIDWVTCNWARGRSGRISWPTAWTRLVCRLDSCSMAAHIHAHSRRSCSLACLVTALQLATNRAAEDESRAVSSLLVVIGFTFGRLVGRTRELERASRQKQRKSDCSGAAGCSVSTRTKRGLVCGRTVVT